MSRFKSTRVLKWRTNHSLINHVLWYSSPTQLREPIPFINRILVRVIGYYTLLSLLYPHRGSIPSKKLISYLDHFRLSLYTSCCLSLVQWLGFAFHIMRIHCHDGITIHIHFASSAPRPTFQCLEISLHYFWLAFAGTANLLTFIPPHAVYYT